MAKRDWWVWAAEKNIVPYINDGDAIPLENAAHADRLTDAETEEMFETLFGGVLHTAS